MYSEVLVRVVNLLELWTIFCNFRLGQCKRKLNLEYNRTRNEGQPGTRSVLKGGGVRNRNKGQNLNKGQWRWEGGGGVSEIFYLPTKELLSFLPFSNANCFRHPVRFQRQKSPKSGKNSLSMCSLASCLTGYAPLSVVLTVLWTQKRFLGTVTLNQGRCFRSGGVSDFTTIERKSQTSVSFPSPLDQKEAIGVVFKSMQPLRQFSSHE